MKVKFNNRILEGICKKWNIIELAVFGSVLRSDFNENSDIDVIVKFNEKSEISLLDIVEIKTELEKLFEREVDIVELQAVKNPFRRKNILSNIEVLYAA
jgi:predicted nucleotidyltransferase